jgi:dTMP kinase
MVATRRIGDNRSEVQPADLNDAGASLRKSHFITFEGIDGAGKSTHVDVLARALRAQQVAFICTREPGGTALAEQLRQLVLQSPMNALTEALLMFGARSDHIEQVIKPALARGQNVLCDRFTDASFAYQGHGRGLETHVLTQLETWVQGSLQPDLTLWFDAEPEKAAQRRAAARAADRFEQQDLDFFERVRTGYVARMQLAPHRMVRIDANAPAEAVAAQVQDALQSRFGALPW